MQTLATFFSLYISPFLMLGKNRVLSSEKLKKKCFFHILQLLSAIISSAVNRKARVDIGVSLIREK